MIHLTTFDINWISSYCSYVVWIYVSVSPRIISDFLLHPLRGVCGFSPDVINFCDNHVASGKSVYARTEFGECWVGICFRCAYKCSISTSNHLTLCNVNILQNIIQSRMVHCEITRKHVVASRVWLLRLHLLPRLQLHTPHEEIKDETYISNNAHILSSFCSVCHNWLEFERYVNELLSLSCSVNRYRCNYLIN
jgi:hypothetical protein